MQNHINYNMKISVHTLDYQADSRIIEAQKKVMAKFEIPVSYTFAQMPHGAWMDAVCTQLDSDVFVFFDSDCVPLDREIVNDSINYAITYDSFIGPAQASNHIAPCSHIFAAPAFFAITKSCYKELGVSFSENLRSDVGQELSYAAESRGKKYRTLYPTKYDGIPAGGHPWRLSNYGYYGIGTLFANRIYHLYEGRLNRNVELFVKRCDQIVNGKFETENMKDSLREI